MYIPGAKVEEHCSNISGDILDSVFYCFSKTIYDIITPHLLSTKKTSMSLKRKKDNPKRLSIKKELFLMS